MSIYYFELYELAKPYQPKERYRLADRANTEQQLITPSYPVKAKLSSQFVLKGYTIQEITG